jgi:hypothetical protein
MLLLPSYQIVLHKCTFLYSRVANKLSTLLLTHHHQEANVTSLSACVSSVPYHFLQDRGKRFTREENEDAKRRRNTIAIEPTTNTMKK